MEDARSDFTATFRQLSEASAEQLRSLNVAQVRPDAALWRRSLLPTLTPISLADVGSWRPVVPPALP